VQNLLSSSLLSKNIKIKIYRNIILPVVLYECETWFVTLREERRLRLFENRVLRIFGPESDEITWKWRKLYNEELNDPYSSHKYYSGDKIEKNEMGGTCSRCGGRREVCTGFWWGNLVERDHLEDLSLVGRILLK